MNADYPAAGLVASSQYIPKYNLLVMPSALIFGRSVQPYLTHEIGLW